MADAESDTAQQLSQSESRAKGEKASAWAHLSFALILLVTASFVVGYSSTYNLSKNLNYIPIYNYKKSVPDKGKALDTVKAYIADKGAWISSDADKCRNLIDYWFPTVTFNGATGSATQPISATCQFTVNLKLGPMEGQLSLKDITVATSTICTNGVYAMNFSLPSPAEGTITGSASVTIAGTVGSQTIAFTDPNVVLGYNLGTLNVGFTACMAKRQELAETIHNATDCAAGFSSPLCTCVRAFTTRVTSWQSRLLSKPGGMAMGGVFTRAVERCLDVKRSHDVRERTSYVYVHSTALLVFAIALVMNGVFNVMMLFGLLQSYWLYGLFFVVYFLVIFLPSLLISNGSGMAEFETTLAMTLPAFVVHAGYLTMLKGVMEQRGIKEKLSHESPFLHPVTFDICLCALTLFTLVERGVVQTEYLVAEVMKCHAVSAVYIALVWYHCQGRQHPMLESEVVQQSYLILYVLGLAGSVSSLVVPYAVKQPFALHWLLPGILTYVAFVNPGWSVHLRMAAQLKNPASAAVYNFNAVSGFLVLLVGAVLLSQFLTVYIQIYGAKNFAWPVQGDPLSYAAIRKVLLPVNNMTVATAL